MFCCQECGKKYRTAQSAQRAVNNGCSKCGGTDIDLDPNPSPPRKRKISSGPIYSPMMALLMGKGGDTPKTTPKEI